MAQEQRDAFASVLKNNKGDINALLEGIKSRSSDSLERRLLGDKEGDEAAAAAQEIAELSQKVEQLGVAQAAAGSEQTTLAFDEFCECVARCGIAKYQAVRQMDNGQKITAFVQNLLGEMSEEDCMRQSTYIRAVRYDLGDSVPLKDESPEEHAAFLAEFKQLDLSGLYGFPLWEADVHDLLHAHFR